LFYRINVVPVELPPLRERREDIPVLADHFLAGAARRMGVTKKTITPPAMERLLGHPFRGNIRELQNLMERCALLIEGPLIEEDSLSLGHPTNNSEVPIPEVQGDLSIKRATRELERKLIVQALKNAHGRKGKAAEMLEISTRALLYKIKEYNILE
ncbi:sigma-54-dependent Fis family transcriptional regulator, partial [Myxococcota bacterium]|nr:sigma-54-dependent Fis family transcriptional regulator [Myxococcota bacterium]